MADAQAPSPQPQRAPQAQERSTAIQTFNGKITKEGDQFMLDDQQRRATYKLDDAEKASRFDGKTVKITGTWDAGTNMIHVDTIEETPSS
jgi:hypothetical protein